MISSLKCFQERETNVNYRRTSQMNYHIHVHYATVVDEMILWNWSYSCKFMVVKIDSWNLHADLCATCANVHRRIEEELDLSCRFLSSGLFKWLYFSKSSKRKICIFHTFVFSWGLSFSKVFCVIFSLFFLMFCIKKFLMRYLKRNGACLRLCETACLCVCVRESQAWCLCEVCECEGWMHWWLFLWTMFYLLQHHFWPSVDSFPSLTVILWHIVHLSPSHVIII